MSTYFSPPGPTKGNGDSWKCPVLEDLGSTLKGSEIETQLSWPVLLTHCRKRPHKWRLEEMAPFLVGSESGNTAHTQIGFPEAI